MLNRIREQVIAGLIVVVIVAILVPVGILVWEKLTDGSLIKALGGAVADQVELLERSQLQCEALPTEEFQQPAKCGPGTYELMRWCSGDCNHDDAKVTICCKN